MKALYRHSLICQYAYAFLFCLALSFASTSSAQLAPMPPPLPTAVSNQPLARLVAGEHEQWLAMTGLGPGKTWRDLRADGYWWQSGQDQWQKLPPLPDEKGRLAAQLVAANGAFWFFGGYTVAEDGHEVSTPQVYRVQPGTDSKAVYQAVPSMPVPVDDAVALVYQDRYIYLISGWHDVGNVNLAQVFDTEKRQWSQAEPWPGAPVFGHAGAIHNNRLMVCGGAKVDYPPQGNRQFNLSEECWQGTIRLDDFRRIDWHPAPAMPLGPRYRAAAAAHDFQGQSYFFFLAGTHNPYNYNGIGYDGNPSAALDSVIAFQLQSQQWVCFNAMSEASMDHRSIVKKADQFILVGGMDHQQQVQNKVLYWQPQQMEECQ